ncbi:KpsF/GutQ family sugar-phosphate isomerase [Qipengyuania qiaonensis]|uniref:KpsF/GutQ family sugar-phosphate isomerase n=1 Tax=Qipengyuania qiaonensis TaxID=2867240 RepID=A0ABS7J6R1_9SPHN|nr:KpsF/GutQ family sugar-phosphate isomerase [Qipengyuania qiaonensis]MBX7481996.1 KpsF/GutQ family sugar-phosphate isomerase [Qipengyuania qiaonensis]
MINDTAASSHLTSALRTLDIEIGGLEDLKRAFSDTSLGDAFEQAAKVFASVKGRIIVTGIGKSGHIARKIAATFCSTGTSALYLHPGEASHGDLGAISRDDVVFAITWSGTTRELGDIVNYCRMYRLPLIVATSNSTSWVGEAADICLTLPVVREACPNELAPTSSTTMQVVLGDALAVALIEARGFSSHSFGLFHPGGSLGAQLTTLNKVMGTDDALPRVTLDATLRSATIEMSRKRYGCTAVVDANGKLVGAFTDGDLRRCIAIHDLDEPIGNHMSPRPVTAEPAMPSVEALALMNDNAVSVLFVTEGEKLVGIVHMHDLVRLGIG